MRLKRAYPLVYPLAMLLLLSSCTTLNIFGTDPVGASLVTMRNGYESVIRESGHAYKAQAITKEQLNKIVQMGRQFHGVYVLAVDAHLLQNEQDTEKYRLQAAALLAKLTDVARSMFGYGGVQS